MLGAWCPTPRPTRKPQKTIRQAYITTLKKLDFDDDDDDEEEEEEEG
jgi:hypothetical protein